MRIARRLFEKSNRRAFDSLKSAASSLDPRAKPTEFVDVLKEMQAFRLHGTERDPSFIETKLKIQTFLSRKDLSSSAIRRLIKAVSLLSLSDEGLWESLSDATKTFPKEAVLDFLHSHVYLGFFHPNSLTEMRDLHLNLKFPGESKLHELIFTGCFSELSAEQEAELIDFLKRVESSQSPMNFDHNLLAPLAMKSAGNVDSDLSQHLKNVIVKCCEQVSVQAFRKSREEMTESIFTSTHFRTISVLSLLQDSARDWKRIEALLTEKIHYSLIDFPSFVLLAEGICEKEGIQTLNEFQALGPVADSLEQRLLREGLLVGEEEYLRFVQAVNGILPSPEFPSSLKNALIRLIQIVREKVAVKSIRGDWGTYSEYIATEENEFSRIING